MRGSRFTSSIAKSGRCSWRPIAGLPGPSGTPRLCWRGLVPGREPRMAKPEKKNGKKDRGKSAEDTGPRGRLVALDGTNGVMLRSEAERLAGICCHPGDPAWSLWDASNTFYEMRMAKAKNLTPTARALLLLYASDLLFRLRWEIEPTLKEGRTVVAAPYVESAMAFGVAAGLPKGWIKELFRFAPKPAASFRLKEKKKGDRKSVV